MQTMLQRSSWMTAAGRLDRQEVGAMAVPVLGTVALGLLALTRRSLVGKLLFAVPAVYVGRQAATAVKEVSSSQRLGHGVMLDESVHIEASPQEVYDFFRNLENLPQFMHHTHDVREDADGRIHWVARIANGMRMEWDGMIIDDEPGKLISWRSAPEEPFEETGTVRFEPSESGGTHVMMRVAYDFGWTPGGTMIAKATEGWTGRMIADELKSLKYILESRPRQTGAVTPTLPLDETMS